ncbi:hypothetical protein PIB30_101894 [Stylosanthes scabra]|uniref:Uncharacterized protein n=1 Tax=Stylosanthes scabra TaxID=79078 RepID=A0ABU6VXD7_9FABA|nr:hypothetical protein [Stylosanthes scabra]
MAEGNQDLDAVTKDICIEGAVWSLGARDNPLYLKRSDLNPVARGWHEFIIHNIMPTKMGQINQVLVNHALDSQAAIRENFRAGRPLFQGMLCPWPLEGSSSALGQQATPAVDVPRNPNANPDDEN